MSTRSPLRLSVVVTVTSGSPYLEACLAALAQQREAPPFEIIVPIDDTLPDATRWIESYPDVLFPRVPNAPARTSSRTDGARHLAYDRRRATGLQAARAPVIALTEDHACPAPDWCERIDAAHRDAPHAVIGGAIQNGNRGAVARASFCCDFGRYEAPFEGGPAEYVSDVNVSYKRAALEDVAATWTNGYHETAVHGAIAERGGTLWLTPDIVVEQRRGPLALNQSLAERYAWGRLYAGKRTEESSTPRRALFALLSPALPLVLLTRHLRRGWQRKPSRTGAPLPLVALLLCAWSLGECVGYWTGDPEGGRKRG